MKKRLLLALAVPLLLTTCAIDSSWAQDFIVWQPGVKLKWDDFLAKPERHNRASALTTSGIHYHGEVNDSDVVDTIAAIFYEDQSWVRHRSDRLLLHEQGHFDITEIYARRLRKRIMEIPVRSDKPEFQLPLIYYVVEAERRKTENLYDEETDHGKNEEGQSRWNDKIRTELDSLKQFAR